ncbi:conserved hypothetical protein [Clostridium acetobutylicum EA 2018]|uniref:Uncharacterized protein n=1 Tax=Clostridium acetobutylicum (strain ATCC 824 / DSM 792 / JCM 1419 / IAM 19013 / LMG 5710 / NBRC 13948 / NRRL B-527 / VKM B-1787 / 2291 / W) TaxID=272562 RepID=Q97JP4_CLOAB|nr:Hypothetical protein, CF-34 family(identical) [Clostridium acetobutylicum ATCC 824]ADZ20280.1 conserved hypothetical protein [Clostridium acetobutylicum EA 2018]AEI31728.1 hypothetical protein SMB_G1250 [Clostridium acetobutylicum DSM 1731]KHD35104.1 hypothetical protein NL50_14490 [Clostridium acetobutylicum]
MLHVNPFTVLNEIDASVRTPTYRRDRCQNWGNGILDLHLNVERGFKDLSFFIILNYNF